MQWVMSRSYLYSIVVLISALACLLVYRSLTTYAGQNAQTYDNSKRRSRRFELAESDERFPCLLLHTAAGDCGIYTYNKGRMAALINETGRWQPEVNQAFVDFLKGEKSAHFIDVGAAIGVYTLTAALMNRQVVAIDANANNLLRLRRSLRWNGFEDRVLLLWNAVAGGKHSGVYRSEPADSTFTIAMDDLLEVVTFKRAIVRLALQCSEERILRQANSFFTSLDVCAVFLQWSCADKLTSSRGAATIRRFFKGLHYAAYPAGRTDRLAQEAPLPEHTVWAREDYKLPKFITYIDTE